MGAVLTSDVLQGDALSGDALSGGALGCAVSERAVSTDDSSPTLPPLRICPIELDLESISLSLGPFSGALWRSGFGLALHRHFPGVFPLLFGPQASLGRLYALSPEFDRLRPGHGAVLRLTLFGPACDHAVACVQALALLGDIGLGQGQGRYRVRAARMVGQAPFLQVGQGLLQWPQPLTPQQCMHHQPEPGADDRTLCLELLSPLRIKAEGEPCLEPIPFDILVRRALGRLAQLSEAAQESHPLDVATRQQLLEQASRVRLLDDSRLLPQAMARSSSRSGQRMVFDGVMGHLRYRGPVQPFRGLLQLIELTQLGAKAAFGFGRLRCHWQEAEPA